MVTHKRSRQELHSRSSSIYSTTSSSNSSLLRFSTLKTNHERVISDRYNKQKRRKMEKEIEKMVNTSTDFASQPQKHSHHHSRYQDSHSPNNSNNNVKSLQTDYSQFEKNQHSGFKPKKSLSLLSSYSDQPVELQMTPVTSHVYSNTPSRYRSHRSINLQHQISPTINNPLLYQPNSTFEAPVPPPHLNSLPKQATKVVRMPTAAVRQSRRQSTRKRKPLPRRPQIHTAASLENLNKIEFGSPALLLLRKNTTSVNGNSRMRRFFLRIFRNRTRPKYYYTKAQLTKGLSLGLSDVDGTVRQYNVRTTQLLGLRPLPKSPSMMRKKSRASKSQRKSKRKLRQQLISEPLTVTKRPGFKDTGNNETLSIQSKRSSSILRVRIPADSPLRQSGSLTSTSSRFGSARSSTQNSYDTVDSRINRLQRELDNTRRMRKHLSNASENTWRTCNSSSSTTSSFLFYRQHSLLRNKSFISLTSQVLSTHEDHPEIITRSDLLTRKSLRYNLGHMTHPPSKNRILRMDEEINGNPDKLDDDLEFVNSWSEYLRRAIAVRVVLQKELKHNDQDEETEWQRQALNSVEEDEEETVSSYMEETESVNTFHTSSSDRSRQATQSSSTDMRLNYQNAAGQYNRDSRGETSNRSNNLPVTPQNQSTERQRSVLSPLADEDLLIQKDFYVGDNGELISITPLSMKTSHAGKILTASAVKLAFSKEQLGTDSLSGKADQMDIEKISSTSQAWQQICDLSSSDSMSLKEIDPNCNQQSKSISSDSTGKSAPIPIPERSRHRVTSKQFLQSNDIASQCEASGAKPTISDEEDTTYHTPTVVSDESSGYALTPLQKTPKNPRPITLSSEGSSASGSGTRDSIYYVLDTQRHGLYDKSVSEEQPFQTQREILHRPMITDREHNIPRMQSGGNLDTAWKQQEAVTSIIAPTVLIPRRQRNSMSSNSSAASAVSLSRGKPNKPNKPSRRYSAGSDVSHSSSNNSGLNYPNAVGTLETDDPRGLDTPWIKI